MDKYTWKDIVEVNGKFYAEEFEISGETDAAGTCYMIDDFIQAVADKYEVDYDDVKTYMLDDISFDPDKMRFGAEECGCYINDVAEWMIRKE